ncbi:short coiled-coil protein isoform X4 [Centrocercus urophasianus]|uniref:short coiled-coil protein isoform X4 n=1 Tax=Centrocercus urophasianus TaxID=9002 RepID=UPI001C6493C1|nr:short coiled-coil protein isoform X4 [Centrocercus urophasianus]XP_052546048.1 short coiled-coil protein isoform X4 [Tympanuchus pallidicinctus]
MDLPVDEEDGTFTNISLADDPDRRSGRLSSKAERAPSTMMNADMDDLSARVDAVKEENLKLKSENQVLGQYIENLMSASSVFQTTDTKSKRK